jgi:hypothetical protein
MEDRLAARSAELAANNQLIQESEAREEAAFQVRLLKIFILLLYLDPTRIFCTLFSLITVKAGNFVTFLTLFNFFSQKYLKVTPSFFPVENYTK